MDKFNIPVSFNTLEKDKESDIQIKKLIDGHTCVFIARLLPKKTLSAHYHTEGSEIYQILSGKGQMNTGKLSEGRIIWHDSFHIESGDIFEIKPGIVHQLSNKNQKDLDIIFITPPSHLGEDRIFIPS
ncbi:MAG: cupin domain-containing protein [Proteobacteria bacterium]|nr:cupin domain-containing protein [Pseudomonadota bacterium]MBU1388188.1 cupin domain-containing protein [Pseudomonadota bacterium]MBU1543000.1 cupin domain-containing protein [Pseudomonadota bacterium]MBU2480487.1 cupin domain-containing protein [Pseudomonadota bacterium]